MCYVKIAYNFAQIQKEKLRQQLKEGAIRRAERGRHTIYVNRATQKSTSIPCHREINDFLAKKICRDLNNTFSLNSVNMSDRSIIESSNRSSSEASISVGEISKGDRRLGR